MATKRLYMHRSHDIAMVLALLINVQLAYSFGTIGVATIDLLARLNMSYSLLGAISVIGAILSMISMMVGGSLVGYIGTRNTIMYTTPIMFVSHIALAVFPSTTTLIVVNIGWGVGFGALLIACTAVIIDWERERRKRIIDAFQASWNIAAIAGALLGGVFLSWQWTFGDVMWAAAITLIPLWVGVLFASFPSSGVIEEASHPLASFSYIAQYRDLLLLGIMMILVTFVQNIGQTWSPIYLDVLGANPIISGAALAAFQAAVALFRLINGVLVSRFSAKVILFCGALGICVSAILLYTVPNQYVVLFAFILMGAAIAGTQPTAISIGVRLHPTKSAALSSGIMALGELGFIISTPLTGWIADMHGMSVAMALALPCGIAMIIAVLLVPRSTS